MSRVCVLSILVLGSLLGVCVGLRRDGSAWLSVSDANLKEHFRDVDGDEVLAKIAQMPINTVDADGFALRAIQALEARTRTQHDQMLEDTQSLADQNDSLVQENAERIAEIVTLKADLAALRAEMATLRGGRR